MIATTVRTSTQGLEARLRILEATDSVRWIMARYMELCDVPQAEADPAFVLDELGALFTADAVWRGLGDAYGNKFGSQHGRDAIVAMLGRYLPPSDHFKANAHVLSEGRINITGSTASGAWVMQQLSAYPDGRRELLVARITAEFALAGAMAQISSFGTQRLFTGPLADSTFQAALASTTH